MEDTMLHVQPDDLFIRVVLPIQLDGGHSIIFTPWMSVSIEVFDTEISTWDNDYLSFACEGTLTNALPPWPTTTRGRPIRVEARNIDELPYVTTSTDAIVSNILTNSWDHDTVLRGLDKLGI